MSTPSKLTRSDIYNISTDQRVIRVIEELLKIVPADTDSISLNTIHRTSDGVDHSYIDQDVTVSSSPTFNSLTTTGGRIVNTTRLVFSDSPYTVLSTDEVIFANTDSGAITINLPAGIEGTHYRISNTGSSSNDVTINRNGTEQVYNNNFQTLKDSDVLNTYYNANDGWF